MLPIEDWPMSRHERVERAMDPCYEAIVVPETWKDALYHLAVARRGIRMSYPQGIPAAVTLGIPDNRCSHGK